MKAKILKWWKDKRLVTPLCVTLSTVIIELVSGIFIPFPYNIAIIGICLLAFAIFAKFYIKKIFDETDNDNK